MSFSHELLGRFRGVSDEHDRRFGGDLLFATRKRPGLHVVLEDLHHGRVREFERCDLVEGNNVPRSDKPNSPRAEMDEELWDCHLAA